ncbi:LysR family transcriptional regulator [Aquabacterium humicola]|uniref:LysR family transcriptional regulator n=1 Tax=Aquabacterium humicola TaxID=3237377 RepID=UPI0025428FD6|nr:LysR family transcriptional regulator [Rubrivivax pictus]
MDKLRSLHYFAAAAELSSFSKAARHFGVSTAAVAKLVQSLERELGLTLFERHPRGLALTAGGTAYLEACGPALVQLAAADEQARAVTSRVSGTVVLGVQPVIAQECLTPALPRFHALYPDIQLDVRLFMRPTEDQLRGIDAALVLGWPQLAAADLVQRQLGATSFVVCAAPAYWAAHGMPQHPSELEQHNCLCIRSNMGSVMDLWQFQRGDERVSVSARGWLVADNVHRDMVRDLAVAGAGVARLIDWNQMQGHEIARGALVPALTDWQHEEVPPVNLLYPPSVRRIPRVRRVLDFVTQLFRDIEQQRALRQPSTAMPRWAKSPRPRASATLG